MTSGIRQLDKQYKRDLTLAGRVNSIGALGISVGKSRPADFHGLEDTFHGNLRVRGS